ncbi:MAG TPA: hypothetical protein PLE51_00315 [Candidatus Pacearchaeota archaeon]|nr:hypothetical protein [Candidatus Pacearchaeota archaeon]HOR52090.1 hypothetical protein [Candidatus Pacearchaeota archaeon]
MENNINLESLSEEEAYELCLKLLDKCNRDVLDMKKSIDDTVNYCSALDNFAKKYPALVNNYLLSKN